MTFRPLGGHPFPSLPPASSERGERRRRCLLGRRRLSAAAQLFPAFECAGQMEIAFLAAEKFDGGSAACHQIAVCRNMFKCHADWHSLCEPDPVEGRVHVGEQIRSLATIAIFNSRFNALDAAVENSRRAH